MTAASVAVVGMTFGRGHIVHTVATDDPCLLLPEPTNPHDPNAIAVHTAPAGALQDSTLTDEGWVVGPLDRAMLTDRRAGYLPRGLAATLTLPGEGVAGRVGAVRFHPDTDAPAGFDVLFDVARYRRTG